MLFHKLGHINADHGRVIIKKEFRKGFTQLGFPNAGWSKKEERADRPVHILKARTSASDCLADGSNSFILPYNAFTQILFHVKELFSFSFQHFINRNSCPAGDNACNVIGSDFFTYDSVLGLPFSVFQLFL